MAKLLVDVGNTRIKFAQSTPQRVGRMQAVAYRGVMRELAAALMPVAGKVDEVVAVSVAGGAVESALQQTVERVLRVPVRFIRSTTPAAGLQVGYAQPWRLGADRWVAVVGAHALAGGHRAVLVIDVGTAMTVDVATRAGLHWGGAIVPGPDLMVSSLLQETRGIRVRAAKSPPGSQRGAALFADNTRSAIDQGARYASAAFIERAVVEARKTLGTRPRVFLTGGGAATLLPLLVTSVEHLPDLVLRGLARFAHARAPSR